MRIEFYLTTEKFVEAHKNSVKELWGEMYKEVLSEYKKFHGTSSKSDGSIKINLQSIHEEFRCNLIYNLYAIIVHETLHSAIGNEETDTIVQHCIIYDIQNALFPGTVDKNTIDWYLIKDW